MPQLDTSVLVACLSGQRVELPRLERALVLGEKMSVSAWALYEWRRGLRTLDEIAVQQKLFPDQAAVAFEFEDALLSAEFYRSLPRARARAADFVIAACAIRRAESLWTLNPRDFADIPGLRLFDPATL